MIFIAGCCLCIFVFPLTVTGERAPGATSSYVKAPGKVLPGPIPRNSYRITRNVTLNQCAAECSLQFHMKQFHCYAFEFVPSTKTCILTNVTTLSVKGGYLGLINNPTMNYFERSKGQYLYLFQPYNHHVIQDEKTYFAIFENVTAETCAKYCLLETRDTCMSFSYSRQKHVCGLSNMFYAQNNGQKLIPSVDYNHYQYFSTWPCNATMLWNYSPGAIATPYYPYASVKDINCHVTIEAPMGKQVDLVFTTLFTQKDICQSQNGGVTVRDGEHFTADIMSTLCSSEKFVNRRFQSSNGYLHVHFRTGNVPMAFKAVYDYIEVDPCSKSPCSNNGTCIPKGGKFMCACAQGYNGSLCEIDIDDCLSSPCLMGGRCIDLVNGYKCECPNLLGGLHCDKFIGLCYIDPCKNGGKCSPRGTDKYVCSCPRGWSGTNCTEAVNDPCSSGPCFTGSECVSDLEKQKFSCICRPGFTGILCETNIDDCARNPCQHNIPCTDLVNDYQCECPTFMAGKNCENFVGRCSEQPCIHGTCKPTGRDNYTCDCEASYTGQHCDVLFINYCFPNPCKHGACTNYADGPSCNCDFGYTGFLCKEKIDHCTGVSCVYGECENLEDDFRCKCVSGYGGKYCNESINHCIGVDCNGGFCINTITSYFCVCRNGFTGFDCDKNVCNPSNCNNGTCIRSVNKSTCVCNPNFTGAHCDRVIDYCINNPCVHGTCSSVYDGFVCACDDNYTGVNCNTLIDHCKINNCVYGFCQNMGTSFKCVCATGYHGELCEYRPNEAGTTPSPLARNTDVTSTIKTFIDHVSIATFYPDPLDCSRSSCVHGICTPEVPNECLCLSGYSGKYCDKFDGCMSNNQCYHGNCEDTPDGSFICNCFPGFEGDKCDRKMSGPCIQTRCQNDGVCVMVVSNNTGLPYSCVCKPGYHGDHCELATACVTSPCTFGHCVPNGMSFRCEVQPLVGTGNSSSISFPFWLGT